MTAERCDLTELLVDQCAHCKGNDKTVEEQDTAERLALRARLLSGRVGGGWFPSQYAGKCWACSDCFEVGTAIRRTRDGELFRDTEPGYVGECCAEETK